MDFLAQFKEYLVEWCHRKHLPVPKQEWSEYWKLAWEDFTKEVLMSNYDDINNHYNSMDIVIPHNSAIESSTDVPLSELVKESEKTEPEQDKSDWEIVQELMKKSK